MKIPMMKPAFRNMNSKIRVQRRARFLLQPNIAKEYGIVRSKNRALLTLSIIKKVEKTPGVSVEGNVSATANNLTAQIKNLTLKQVREGEAIYYIGDIAVANDEVLVFNIEATPVNETDPFKVRFSRRFVTY